MKAQLSPASFILAIIGVLLVFGWHWHSQLAVTALLTLAAVGVLLVSLFVVTFVRETRRHRPPPQPKQLEPAKNLARTSDAE